MALSASFAYSVLLVPRYRLFVVVASIGLFVDGYVVPVLALVGNQRASLCFVLVGVGQCLLFSFGPLF